MTISDIMSYIVEHRAANLPPDAIAEVLDRLIWCLSDNGEGILDERKIWLSSEDLFKIEIALAMDETFPYETREGMVTKFNEIVEKWPKLKKRCDEILLEWDKQFNRK